MATGTIDGYLGGEVYPSSFHRQFTTPWIDAMLRHRGLAPPRATDRLNSAAARAGWPLQALVGRRGVMPVTQATIVAAGDGDADARASIARLGIAAASLSGE